MKKIVTIISAVIAISACTTVEERKVEVKPTIVDEWTYLDESMMMVAYSNTAMARRRGDFLTTTLLIDSKENGSSKSATQDIEFSCSKRAIRFISAKEYDQHMGKGSVVRQFEMAKEWSPVKPESALDILRTSQCDLVKPQSMNGKQ